MPSLRAQWSIVALAALSLAGCATMPLYPPRPPSSLGAPMADPAPSKVVVHFTVTPEGLNKAIDLALPMEGASTFELRGPRPWKWSRTPIAFKFADGKIHAESTVNVSAELPIIGTQSLSLDLKMSGEPVLTSEYKAKLQSAKVELTSKDMKVKAADAVTSALKKLRDEFQTLVENYSFDLAPRVMEAYARLAVPIELPLGEAKGCLAVKVTGVEAGPTVLAGGFEKDLALVVAPSVTMPCNPPALPPQPTPLANVATLPSGPFTVTAPIAASYAELQKAMTMAFTDGKLYFSKDFPELYLTDPEIYASQNQLVLKLRLAGVAKASGLSLNLDGNIFFAGHPAVIDNELQIPDLQPTIETSDFLLKLKAKLDGDSIRDQARQALRLDLGERLGAVRAKVSGDFQFNPGCLRSDVARIEVTGIYPHGSYLRIYVAATAQASVYVPCPTLPAEAPEPAPVAAPAPTAAPAPAPAATPAAAPSPAAPAASQVK
ncbi:MAG TPA: DUF4403 family protein [Myxococcales bacterium]|jgi:hypothetical protein